jgi:large subunit ribosomal protein L33
VAAPSAPASSAKSSSKGIDAMRELISLQCEQCKRRNYTSTKNKKTSTEKLAMRKFCSSCRTHTVHKESKV